MSAFGGGAPQNPMQSARRLAAPVKPRRFYSTVEMRPEPGGFTLRLDGKPAMTPGRNPLAVPHRRLADAIAAEWSAQIEHIDPGDMPATRLANSAIDGVAPRRQAVRDVLAEYAGTDLLFYRAGAPEGLVERQRELWDPVLEWARERFGVRFILAEGVMHVAQPDAALQAIRAELAAIEDPFRLAALSLATTLTGSALIALTLNSCAMEVERAWAAAHVDEDWNISQWGEDAEAKERRARRYADFRAAALLLTRPEEPG